MSLPERLYNERVQVSHREATRFPCSSIAVRSLLFKAGGLMMTSKKRLASRWSRAIVSCFWMAFSAFSRALDTIKPLTVFPSNEAARSIRSFAVVRRRIARVFVCTTDGSNTILGFYTLSALAIDLSSLPEELSRKLPRHPVPCALIGRLAVDQSVRGHGLGRMLLVDAIKRTMGASDVMAIHAVIVDAKNNAAKQFYEVYGFAPMQDDPMRLFLPLGSIPL